VCNEHKKGKSLGINTAETREEAYAEVVAWLWKVHHSPIVA